MNESEIYKELGVLTKDKYRWKENIPYLSALLAHTGIGRQANLYLWRNENGRLYFLQNRLRRNTVPESL